MSDSFRATFELLRREVAGLRAAKAFSEAKGRHEVLAGFDDIAAMLEVLGRPESAIDQRDAITQALLKEQAKAKSTIWSSILMVAYHPMLSRLRHQLVCNELAKEDLDQLVLESFLCVTANYSPKGWQVAAPVRLRYYTRRRVFDLLKRQFAGCKWIERERQRVRQDFEAVPVAMTGGPPVSFRVEAVYAAIDEIPSKEGGELVANTRLSPVSLRQYVSNLGIADNGQREREYQRLKRKRSRAIRRFRNTIAGQL